MQRTIYTIPINYTLKWQMKTKPHIQISVDKIVINTITGHVIKETICGESYGYWIGRKFILTSKMNQHIEKIANFEVPF